jgi:molybdenum cofactor synthesis domain-containing protein
MPYMSTAAVITISDSRSAGRAEDTGGPAVAEALASLGLQVVERCVVPDDAPRIAATVRGFVGRVSVIATTGGTGVGPRDVTPEALRPLFDRELPGFGEIMRTGTYAQTPLSIISRGGAGVAGNTLIVMLPGSPKAVRECLSLLGPAIKHLLKLFTTERLDCQQEGTHT